MGSVTRRTNCVQLWPRTPMSLLVSCQCAPFVISVGFPAFCLPFIFHRIPNTHEMLVLRPFVCAFQKLRGGQMNLLSGLGGHARTIFETIAPCRGVFKRVPGCTSNYFLHFVHVTF